jgi:hypothetical protein
VTEGTLIVFGSASPDPDAASDRARMDSMRKKLEAAGIWRRV